MAPQSKWFAASPNTDYIFKSLTDGTVTKMTGGRIPQMTPTQAAGLIGSWVIETGRKDLTNLDVVEAGSGRGRGLSQYTGVRRTPYDQAAAAAKAAGKDPNSAQWQLEYFAKEYMNRDLIGWTRVFENMPKNLKSAGDYAKYFTGSAAEGKGYFRPGTPHTDRRIQAAQEVLKHYTAPKPQTPAVAPVDKTGPNQFLDGVLQKLGIKGGPQSFNTDKIQSILGNMAANPDVKSDVGLAIFASKAKGDVLRKWNSLPNNTKQAYRTVGGQLGFTISQASTYSLPKTISSVGPNASSQYNPATKTDLSVGGARPGDLGYGTTGTPRGLSGLPGLGEISQAAVNGRVPFSKATTNSYGSRAYSSSFGNRVAGINERSYGAGLNISSSVGPISSATASGSGSIANSGYTWSSTASASNSWKTGFGIN